MCFDGVHPSCQLLDQVISPYSKIKKLIFKKKKQFAQGAGLKFDSLFMSQTPLKDPFILRALGLLGTWILLYPLFCMILSNFQLSLTTEQSDLNLHCVIIDPNCQLARTKNQYGKTPLSDSRKGQMRCKDPP